MTMNREKVIDKIKSKGYWEINIRPDVYDSQRIERNKLKEIVRSAVVELRGWPYPFFGHGKDEPYNIPNGIEECFEWANYNYREFWRMTQSGNFYHLLALREDWEVSKGKQRLGVWGTLYTLTEIFEFAKRLASQNIFDDNVIIEIRLYGLANRILEIDSSNKVPFISDKEARISQPWTYDKNLFSVNELLSKAGELALNAFVNLVRLFQWDNPPIESLKNDQQKFLQGRI